ncbi:MAG: hypothetical protein AVDCRST_MAG59-542, partial [uncultured Thermomicrobiales bacterium]
ASATRPRHPCPAHQRRSILLQLRHPTDHAGVAGESSIV